MAELKITTATLELFAKLRIIHGPLLAGRWRVGDYIGYSPPVVLEPYCQINQGNWLPVRMGSFSYSHSGFGAHVAVGRYCSIGAGVAWMGGRHPLEWISTSPVNYGPAQPQVAQFFADREVGRRTVAPPHVNPKVRIGNDVWIGDGAMIKPGITIGDGAVIGARSLVLKDVEPYSIVAGSPAKLMRYRFSEDIVERLQRIAWWRFTPDIVQRCDFTDPASFCDEFERLVAEESPSAMRPICIDASALEGTSRGDPTT